MNVLSRLSSMKQNQDFTINEATYFVNGGGEMNIDAKILEYKYRIQTSEKNFKTTSKEL